MANSSRRRALLGALLVAAVLGLGWRPLLQPGGAAQREAQQQRQPRRAAAEVQTADATLAVGGESAAAEAAVAAAVAGSAGVHGFVTKQGVADPRNWHPDHKALRAERLEAWLAEREAALAAGASLATALSACSSAVAASAPPGWPAAMLRCLPLQQQLQFVARCIEHAAALSCCRLHGPPTRAQVCHPHTTHAPRPAGGVPPPLPIYTGCQVYVNHLYRVIYLRHAKTASSSLFCHFGGCRDGDDADTARLRFELLKVRKAPAVPAAHARWHPGAVGTARVALHARPGVAEPPVLRLCRRRLRPAPPTPTGRSPPAPPAPPPPPGGLAGGAGAHLGGVPGGHLCALAADAGHQLVSALLEGGGSGAVARAGS